MKDVLIIPVHGMGDTPRDFADPLKEILEEELEELWPRCAWQPIYYQSVLQSNQRRMMSSMVAEGNIDWLRLRRFLLFGFSDAAGMEMKPQEPGSIYEAIQQTIVNALDKGYRAVGERLVPVVMITHSMGCQVLSNYIWDAQQKKVAAGVFAPQHRFAIGRRSRRDKFLRLMSLQSLFTTGCNIPVFVAGLPASKIIPVTNRGKRWQFDWFNYYDPDDVLGWPLKPINRAYARTVKVDEAINASAGLIDWFKSWTPLTHGAYWRDKDVVRPLAREIKRALTE